MKFYFDFEGQRVSGLGDPFIKSKNREKVAIGYSTKNMKSQGSNTCVINWKVGEIYGQHRPIIIFERNSVNYKLRYIKIQ